MELYTFIILAAVLFSIGILLNNLGYIKTKCEPIYGSGGEAAPPPVPGMGFQFSSYVPSALLPPTQPPLAVHVQEPQFTSPPPPAEEPQFTPPPAPEPSAPPVPEQPKIPMTQSVVPDSDGYAKYVDILAQRKIYEAVGLSAETSAFNM
ncbi:hypothetical protein CCFV1_ORF086 [Cotesia congregata filamentous virus 1]|uniref:Uncharacterized protein n=1 Tax=Cotesia congregata filamentous virus 1 TaxID=3064291 RepID=A0ABC8QPT6_9VIRU|nr:hypothetical protein CCFV1_ORF086 [Cotesia congregata filamentous virus 1]